MIPYAIISINLRRYMIQCLMSKTIWYLNLTYYTCYVDSHLRMYHEVKNKASRYNIVGTSSSTLVPIWYVYKIHEDG